MIVGSLCTKIMGTLVYPRKGNLIWKRQFSGHCLHLALFLKGKLRWLQLNVRYIASFRPCIINFMDRKGKVPVVSDRDTRKDSSLVTCSVSLSCFHALTGNMWREMTMGRVLEQEREWEGGISDSLLLTHYLARSDHSENTNALTLSF